MPCRAAQSGGTDLKLLPWGSVWALLVLRLLLRRWKLEPCEVEVDHLRGRLLLLTVYLPNVRACMRRARAYARERARVRAYVYCVCTCTVVRWGVWEAGNSKWCPHAGGERVSAWDL